MALENYISNIQNSGFDEVTADIKNPQAFGDELAVSLSRIFNIKHNFLPIPILTKGKAPEIEKEFDKTSDSYFSYKLASIIIAEGDRNAPLTYGHELAHGFRYYTNLRDEAPLKDEQVDEFLAYLGKIATGAVLSTITKNDGLKFFSPRSILEDLNYYKLLDCSYKDELEQVIEQIKVHEEERVKQIRASHGKVQEKLHSAYQLECHLYGSYTREAFDMFVKKYKSELKFGKVPLILYSKKLELDLKIRESESSINHMIGYLIASITYPIAFDDKKLFYRPTNEIRKLYFEPVFRNDLLSFDSPDFTKRFDSTLAEMRQKVLEG